MLDDEINKIATQHVKSEWTRLGVAGSHKERDEEIFRVEGILKKALGILEGQGCLVVRVLNRVPVVTV